MALFLRFVGSQRNIFFLVMTRLNVWTHTQCSVIRFVWESMRFWFPFNICFMLLFSSGYYLFVHFVGIWMGQDFTVDLHACLCLGACLSMSVCLCEKECACEVACFSKVLSLFLSPSPHSAPLIEAVGTSAPSDLEGFKAHTVFQEINKKLQEVSRLLFWSLRLPLQTFKPCPLSSSRYVLLCDA